MHGRSAQVATRDATARSGGRILVDQLAVHGVDMVFCVPGESYLDVLDALHDTQGAIPLINARHEAGAANMAEAYGKLTGRPGICLVTRGPGACHAAVGVHTAFQDSTPMILLIGQVGRAMLDREAFQEIDYRAMFAPVAKWAAQIDSTARIPEYLSRAFRVATSGRPGPVVLALPEDMLQEAARVADAEPYGPALAGPTDSQLLEMQALLARAERPLAIVGGSGWTDEACADIRTFAEANGLPVACSFRRQDIFDNGSACYVGAFGTSASPALLRRAGEADLLLVIGARLGEMTTQGYAAISPSQPRQAVIHVHPGSDELGRVFSPALAICAPVAPVAASLAAARWFDPGRFAAWREGTRSEFEDFRTPPPGAWRLDLGRAMALLHERLPADFILTLDAGNHTGWPQRFLRYARPARQLGATSGAMGYGVPAAVAASLLHPERLVVGCVGDGGFMMSGHELATAVQHGGKPIVLLFNNNMYGTIRMHQEREYPGRVVGTDLVNPDFVAMGRAMGVHAERVETTDAFMPAIERAIAAARPALIELVTDPEQISVRHTIAELRHAATEH